MGTHDEPDRVINTARTRMLAVTVITLLVAVTAVTGSQATLPVIETWYAGLVKPNFNPPNWIFGPVWTLLYILLIYSTWRVAIRIFSQKELVKTTIIFIIQLVFNASWSLVFFGQKDPETALIVVIGLEASVIAMIFNFARTDRLAAALQLPYAAWVAFASLLNLAIVLLNSSA